jgi:hypothetical protein
MTARATGAAVAERPAPTGKRAKILERTVCLALSFTRPGIKRRIDISNVQTKDADKKMLQMTKRILDSAEFRKVTTLDHSLREYIESRSVPFPLKGGMYLVNLVAVKSIVKRVRTHAETDRPAAVKTAVKAYPKRRDEAIKALGFLGDVRDYPTVEEFEASFGFEWELISLETPESIRLVGEDVYETAMKRAEAQVRSAALDAEAMIREQAKALIDHALDRLTPDPETGKLRSFRDGTINNLIEFAELFPLRNVNEDGALGSQLAKLKSSLAGVDAKTIKKQDGLRASIVSTVAAAKAAVDALVIERPRRRFGVAD